MCCRGSEASPLGEYPEGLSPLGDSLGGGAERPPLGVEGAAPPHIGFAETGKEEN